MSDANTNEARAVIVVPTYNEAGNVEALIRRLSATPLSNASLILVDDGSPDGTADLAERVASELPAERQGFVQVLRRPGKQGLGRAYVAGMSEALKSDPDVIVQMDCDLSHPPECIPALLATLHQTGADVVIGSRYVRGASLADEWSLRRRLLSGWANFYVNAILSMNLSDATAGFKAWRAARLAKLGLNEVVSSGYSFQVEMNYRCLQSGGTIVEYPIHFRERDAGRSKMSFRVQLESALLPLKLRWGKARHEPK